LLKQRYHIFIAAFILSIVLWVSLNLNQTYEIKKTVPVKISINKPYAVGGNVPLYLDVKFRGIGWNLIRLFTSLNLEFNYDITARKKDQFVILTKNYLESNMGSSQELYIESIYPDTIFIKIENYEEKYVKLLPRINVNCMDGYQMVGQPVIEPDSIKIGGGVDVLKNLDFLFTHEQAFNNVNSSIIKNIGVTDSLSNIIWRSQNEIKLTVNVELTAEKEFTNIEIKVPNVPNDKEVLLIPQSISLQLKGGINQLSAVDASKLRVYIDYNSILNDTTGSLEPKIELPHGCIIISVKPDKIQYVIKNKSS
jgi:YbbR domain-containing protein